MMKKYISLILAGLLMFTAAGCGSETNAETDTESTGEYVNLQAQMPEEGEEIAVIDTSKGVVKGLKKGRATITAYSGKVKMTFKVTVK